MDDGDTWERYDYRYAVKAEAVAWRHALGEASEMQCKGGGESSRYCGRDDEVPALGSDEHEIEALREISSERDREREKDWVPDEAEPSLLRRLRSKPRTSIVGHWDGVVMRVRPSSAAAATDGAHSSSSSGRSSDSGNCGGVARGRSSAPTLPEQRHTLHAAHATSAAVTQQQASNPGSSRARGVSSPGGLASSLSVPQVLVRLLSWGGSARKQGRSNRVTPQKGHAACLVQARAAAAEGAAAEAAAAGVAVESSAAAAVGASRVLPQGRSNRVTPQKGHAAGLEQAAAAAEEAAATGVADDVSAATAVGARRVLVLPRQCTAGSSISGGRAQPGDSFGLPPRPPSAPSRLPGGEQQRPPSWTSSPSSTYRQVCADPSSAPPRLAAGGLPPRASPVPPRPEASARLQRPAASARVKLGGWVGGSSGWGDIGMAADCAAAPLPSSQAAGHQGDETGICIGTGTGTDLAGTGTRCPTSNGNWS